jgi:hypothetical protein
MFENGKMRLESILRRREGAERRMIEGVNLGCIASTLVKMIMYPQCIKNMTTKIKTF